MRRGTTPVITLSVDMDITEYTVFVALKSRNHSLILDDSRISKDFQDGKTVIVFALSQAETLDFSPGECKVQIRAVKGQTAIATDIGMLEIDPILQQGIIHGA